MNHVRSKLQTMMKDHACLQSRLVEELNKKQKEGYLLFPGNTKSSLVDFSSNDYLSLARVDSTFQDLLNQATSTTITQHVSSSTGSRILTGNSQDIVNLEAMAAKFHQAESAILFNSGYDANLAVLSSIPQQEDIFIYDEFVHASSHDGMRLSRARSNTYAYRHNDLNSMRLQIERAVKRHTGNVLVCVETVYSMDGDVSPLRATLDQCRVLSEITKRDVQVIVDEAHSGGLFGDHGEGMIVSESLQHHPNLMGRVITFGKAFAAHGAVVVGSKTLVDYLFNFGRPVIFSTAMPPHSVAVLTEMYRFAKSAQASEARERLWKRVGLFKRLASKYLPPGMVPTTTGESAVQVFLVPGTKNVKRLNRALTLKGYGTYAVYYPAVPKGEERIRIVIHSNNTEEEIKGLILSASQAVNERSARL